MWDFVIFIHLPISVSVYGWMYGCMDVWMYILIHATIIQTFIYV